MAASEHQYFCEDEVYRVTKKGNVQFGMVVENSEFVSGDENSDEEEEEGGRMKKGHIRVSWHPTGVEEVIPEGKVQLADRALMPGDVVRRLIKGKDTQRGYCRDIRVSASVQVVGTKQVIINVGSANLIPLEEFGVDIVACLDSWVGSIKNVHSKLILQCKDGSRCMISDVDACGFESFTDKRDMEFTGHRDDFYTGQTLWGPVHVLEDADWLHCTKEMKANCSKPNKTIKVVVEDVKTDNVGINWQCRAYSKDGANADKEQPKFLVQGEDLKRLKLLNVFEPCTVQVGDRNFYTFREGDTVIMKEQWRKEQKDRVLNVALNARRNSWMKRNSKQIKLQNAAAAAMAVTNGKAVNGTDESAAEALEAMPPPPPPPADHDEWDTEDTTSISDTASISSGASSIASQAKKKRGPALMTKVLKKKKLRRARRRIPNVNLEPGARVVVETLSTSSIADVVWQDGTVEENILSTQLYPIHHLDDQEFFPGDFVIENKDDGCMQVYGVVQSVDHLGRTACVKWFKTYTSLEDPQPALLQETEVSVYDMKDHPDFQYRPGTVVIRVANFEGADAQCTAGQVLDNYPKGMVRVWWVDGHVSMSWPQDLYKVGEYDSDEGELWDDGSSDASWETESEDCFIAEDDIQLDEDEIMREKLNPRLGANIEKARIAMSRLEEIFMQNPTLQTTKVMRQLLEAYKDCRYLDKLMGTSFFHESHFHGLLERVRERGRANAAQRVADQVNRLFQNPDGTDIEVDPMETNDDEYFLDNRSSDLEDIHYQDMDTSAGNSISLESVTPSVKRKLQTAANNNKNAADSEHNKEERPSKRDAEDKKSKDGGKAGKTQLEPKGSKHARPAPPAPTPAAPTATADQPMPMENAMGAFSGANSHVCAKLCALIKTQLLKAHGEVTQRFCANPSMTLSGAVGSGSGSSDKSEGDMDESCRAESAAPAVPVPTPGAEGAGGESVLTKVKGGIESLLQRLSPSAPPAGTKETEPIVETERTAETDMVTECPLVIDESYVEDDAQERCLNPEGFSVADCAPSSHKFKLTMFQPTDPSGFFRAVRKELRLLKTSLPAGIWVKGFEDRMDLYSVMIRGPEKTPYEDGLFFFDFQLSADYPRAPPLCHYVSYCSDRLNPNLYEDGKVCVSLLGTWSGKGTEVWTPSSNLLQVIVSIQGLILVSEPYFNEAGYEKQKGSQSGSENSRMYNEMAVLKLVQALTKMAVHPPPVFDSEIKQHFSDNGHKFLNRLDSWLDISEGYNNTHPVTPTTPSTFREGHSLLADIQLPEFPLIPASKGFCLTLRKTIVTLKEVLASVGIHEKLPAS